MNKKQENIYATGTQVISREHCIASRTTEESIDYIQDNTIAFGYRDITIHWNGIEKPISKSFFEDKFLVYAPTLEEARAEFWARWSHFVKRAFNRDFLRIIDNN